MPMRKVISHGRNLIGRFSSLKMKRMVSFESLLELDEIFLLEVNPNVTWYAEQPLTIEYEYNGKIYHYTPDFHSILDGRDQLIEVKPDVFTETAENQQKFKAAIAWCEDRDWTFHVATASEIRSQPRLRNARLLVNSARYSVAITEQSTIVTQLTRASQPLTVLDLAMRIDPGRIHWTLIAVCYMAFYRKVFFTADDKPITLASLVSLSTI